MRVYILTTFIGIFAVDENKKILTFKPFPKNPELIAQQYKTSEFEVTADEKKLMYELGKKGYREFVFPFRKNGARNIEANTDQEAFIKDNLRKFAVERQFVKDQTEFNNLLTKINLEMTKVKIKKAMGRDGLVVQANGALEELDRSINVLIERLREWYGLHFPEMNRVVDSHEKYATLIEKFGQRMMIDDQELKQFTEKSMGMDLKEDDIKIIQSFASEISSLYKTREKISKYLDTILKEVAPNLRELAGPLLAAKLISKAGGLEKIARSPSSTIQLLGAEKALFRFLHGRGKSPKFGILFNHPLVQNASIDQKGKIARTLASKLSIAVKIDFYSHEYKADGLKKDLDERMKKIAKGR
ncbi:MAG: C/D box methylation guide ribonucleoprotein complex aNOP56 subunit [Candidatus Aenigmatarchaeota archaeon]